jgi:hypothetical protein
MMRVFIYLLDEYEGFLFILLNQTFSNEFSQTSQAHSTCDHLGESSHFPFLYLILSWFQIGWHQKAKMPAQKASLAHTHMVSKRENRQHMTTV